MSDSGTTTKPGDFAAVRDYFPHTENVVYFNSASYGPFCTPVAEAIRANIDQRVAAEKDDSHDAFETAEQLRSVYARLVGAPDGSVGIGLNTSHGLNVAAFGLPLRPGDEILIPDIEFPAVVYTWTAAAEKRDLVLKYFPTRDRFFDQNMMESAVTSKTKVISISWVQFFNGYKVDLKRLSRFCREREIYLIVDGIQGMGVEPIDVVALDLDVFTTGCQKWMLAPQGCGFFYLSDRIRGLIDPPFMSWLGVDWQMNFTDLFHKDRPFFDSARKYEMGYYAVLNLMGMKAAAEIFERLGIANIQKHNHSLIDRLAEYVKGSPKYRITSSMESAHRSSIFTFAGEDNQELHRELLRNRIILVQREGSIRVSVHLFNDESDVDRMIEVLDKFDG